MQAEKEILSESIPEAKTAKPAQFLDKPHSFCAPGQQRQIKNKPIIFSEIPD